MSASLPKVPRGLRFLERLAWLMDDAFEIPFLHTRVGWDAVVGLVPWAGDAVTALLALLIVAGAVRYRVPRIVIVRMAMNVAFDYLVGLIPVFGDAADIVVRSNRWNLDLLRKYQGGERRPSPGDIAFVAIVLGGALALMVGAMVGMIWLVTRFVAHAPRNLM